MTIQYEPDPLDAEWDKLPHTPDAYRAEIRQLRERCAAYAAAIEAEREACAKVCEARHMGDNNREDAEARRCAAAIRARDEP